MEFKTLFLLLCSLSSWVLQSLCWQCEVCQVSPSQLHLRRCISELQVWKELLSLWERPSIHGLHQWVASFCSGLSFLLLHLYLHNSSPACFLSCPTAVSHPLPLVSSWVLDRLLKNRWAGFVSFWFRSLLLVPCQTREGEIGFLYCYQYFQPSVLNCTLKGLSVYKKTWSLIA